MQWRVSINGKDRFISLPDSIPDNVSFDVDVDGRRRQARWQKSTRSLYLLEPGSKSLWSCINLRSMSTSKFPGESDTNVTAEFVPPGAVSTISMDLTVSLHIPGQESRSAAAAKKPKIVRSQITGKVLKVLVKSGDSVASGDTLMIIEAMKMENRVMASTSGVVDQVKINEGDTVAAGAELIRFKQS
jgi:biotin carboxyl carrier protein